MQLNEVLGLLDNACKLYVDDLVKQQNKVSGKDLGDLSSRTFNDDEEESIPLSFIIQVFSQNFDWKNLLENRPGNFRGEKFMMFLRLFFTYHTVHEDAEIYMTIQKKARALDYTHERKPSSPLLKARKKVVIFNESVTQPTPQHSSREIGLKPIV